MAMRKPTLAAALLVALLVPTVALAHPERTTFFPDHTKGERPMTASVARRIRSRRSSPRACWGTRDTGIPTEGR